jgi:hypothetical protein
MVKVVGVVLMPMLILVQVLVYLLREAVAPGLTTV